MLGTIDRRAATVEEEPTPVFVLDDEGRFSYVNRDAEEIFQADRRKLEGQTFREQIPESMWETYREPFARALKGDDPTEFETKCPLTERWYRFQVYPCQDRLTVHAHDIEDRARRDGALELRERALRSAHEVIADPDRSLDRKIEGLLAVVRGALGTDSAALAEVDPAEGTYRLLAVDGALQDGSPPREPFPLGEAPNCARVARTGQTLVLPASTRPDPLLPSGSYLGVPVKLDDEVRGTLRLASAEPRQDGFGDWEISYAEIFANWIGKELSRRDGFASL